MQSANPIPTKRQLDWHKLETYAFVHFGPNTFTGDEWGSGRTPAAQFDPKKLDCRQWCREFKAAGLKAVIVTAKHHDGFCLWPSKFSTYTVAASPWRNGKGDILRELSEACKEYKLKFGVYLSPWDRNHPTYGTPGYNEVFKSMLREVLTSYGSVFEVWFDGANGEGPNGKRQVYDWPGFIATVRKYAPSACIFGDGGPDVRWVGNENGIASETNWGTIKKDRYQPGTPHFVELGQGDPNGEIYVPAECDVSIRPGWFWRATENSRVKSGSTLLDLYLKSVGRNANLLLNVPPNTDGLIADEDIRSLRSFQNKVKGLRRTKLAKTSKSEIALNSAQMFDVVEICEDLRQGQRVSQFVVEAWIDKAWRTIASGTTIGNKRIFSIQPVVASRVRLRIEQSSGEPKIKSMTMYASDDVNRDAPDERNARMKWWRESRFGMFIHWGLYSIPAGEWRGKMYGGASEWLPYTAKIQASDWAPLLNQFNPVNYDPDRWVQIAKNAGMKYIVITSKHHEGFALWDTKTTDFGVRNTPYGKDLLKPLAAACEKHGIKLCFYHSILDWHHPDYGHREDHDQRPPSKNFDRYAAYMQAQLKELLEQYPKLGVLWFDGEWHDCWTAERGEELYRWIRQMNPNIIVNNRVGKARAGMDGMDSGQGAAGDFGTPEQRIPPSGLPGVDWESCMTFNESWGFHKGDNAWKSATTIIQNLVDCASKGGNYLLNVGPTALGEIPNESVTRLEEVGRWLKDNGEAIYSTSAGPFRRPLPWGRVTQRGNLLYLHIFDRKARSISLPGLKTRIKQVYPLREPTEGSLMIGGGPDGPTIPIAEWSDEPVKVYCVFLDGIADVEDVPIRQDESGVLRASAVEAQINGAGVAQYEPDKDCVGFWTDIRDFLSWNVRLSAGRFDVEITLACDRASQGADYTLNIGDKALSGTVGATGGWGDFVTIKLGSIAVSKAGKHQIEVRATKIPNGAVMNLRSIVLRPTK